MINVFIQTEEGKQLQKLQLAPSELNNLIELITQYGFIDESDNNIHLQYNESAYFTQKGFIIEVS
jgi:hypothetical protein